MSSTSLKDRRVLVVGTGLMACAEQGLPSAAIEPVSLEALDEALAQPRVADLILIDADDVDAHRLALAIRGLAQAAAPPAVVMFAAHLPSSVARDLFRLKRVDVLEPPYSPADLARAAAHLLAPGGAEGGAHRSQVWSIIGAVGGAGGTTLAIELAATLAGRTLGDRVALIDLNLADGAACAYLGAMAGMSLAEAAGAPERIDANLLDAFSVRAAGGFDLFASPRDPGAFAKVTPAVVCRLLDVACQVYDWVLVDLPRGRQPWSLDVLCGSDEVLVVSELTVPALLAARALVGEVEAELPDGKRPRLILNRLASRVFGPAPSRAEAERALGRKVDGAITSDWEAAACSVNLGGPISQHRPKSKIVKDVAVLVENLTATHASAQAAPLRAKVA
jgi:pilus assembly protein CpaE